MNPSIWLNHDLVHTWTWMSWTREYHIHGWSIQPWIWYNHVHDIHVHVWIEESMNKYFDIHPWIVSNMNPWIFIQAWIFVNIQYNQAIIRCYSLPSSIFSNIQAPIHQYSLLFINIRQYSVIFKLIFASIQARTDSRLNQLFHIHGFQIHSWIWFSYTAKYHIHRWIWFKDEYNIFDS